MENWKEIFRDDNEWNEKSIIGFVAFMFFTGYSFHRCSIRYKR